MKLPLQLILCATLASFLIVSAYTLGARRSLSACELRRSPLDGQTIEVWRHGALSNEWQPDDGAIYTMLDHALRDEMPYEALELYRQRQQKRERP